MMAAGAGFASNTALCVAWFLGYLSWNAEFLLLYLCLSTVIYLLPSWLIHTRRNLRFADPSLSIFQLGVHVVLVTFLMINAPGMRHWLIIHFLIIMLFALFRYRPRQIVALALLLFSCYVLSVVLHFIQNGLYPLHWEQETMTALVFVLALIGLSLLGVEIVNLRLTLKTRNADLAKAMEKIEALVITDELTGLYNRRYLDQLLDAQKQLADRGGCYQFSIAFVDLDYFKQVNDTYGHAAGDLILQQVAQVIRLSVRDVDYVARYGGEEFVVVLAQAGEKEAQEVAERVRQDIEQVVIALEGVTEPVKVTASIGIACYQVPESVESVSARADKALYVAKNQGRNSIVLATDQLFDPAVPGGATGLDDPYDPTLLD